MLGQAGSPAQEGGDGEGGREQGRSHPSELGIMEDSLDLFISDQATRENLQAIRETGSEECFLFRFSAASKAVRLKAKLPCVEIHREEVKCAGPRAPPSPGLLLPFCSRHTCSVPS